MITCFVKGRSMIWIHDEETGFGRHKNCSMIRLGIWPRGRASAGRSKEEDTEKLGIGNWQNGVDDRVLSRKKRRRKELSKDCDVGKKAHSSTSGFLRGFYSPRFDVRQAVGNAVGKCKTGGRTIAAERLDASNAVEGVADVE